MKAEGYIVDYANTIVGGVATLTVTLKHPQASYIATHRSFTPPAAWG